MKLKGNELPKRKPSIAIQLIQQTRSIRASQAFLLMKLKRVLLMNFKLDPLTRLRASGMVPLTLILQLRRKNSLRMTQRLLRTKLLRRSRLQMNKLPPKILSPCLRLTLRLRLMKLCVFWRN